MRTIQPSLRLTAATAAAALLATPALAGNSLSRLQAGMQQCMDSAAAPACRAFEAQVSALRQSPAYAGSTHLCKEEISELSQVAALLPMRDAVATELMASVADVQQACQSSGF
jgi:cobalamin synthase